tara:strand:- start:111 stop:461 length:351 start_codon:yes stop_codon:yes gene_type:complete
MLKKILITNLFLLSLSFTSSIAQELNCEYFEGEWKGNKKGTGYSGEISVIFKNNCKYKWIGSRGQTVTPGKIKFKKNKISYINGAGSRGKVTLEDNTLTFRNVYTGNSYKVVVTKK